MFLKILEFFASAILILLGLYILLIMFKEIIKQLRK